MIVWILSIGEPHEGRSVVSVHASKAGADAALATWEQENPEGASWMDAVVSSWTVQP